MNQFERIIEQLISTKYYTPCAFKLTGKSCQDWYNVPDTSEDNWSSGTWIKYWEKFSKSVADKCCVKGCGNEAKHGAHVKQADDDAMYIVPMCSFHNHPSKTNFFDFKSGTVVVEVE